MMVSLRQLGHADEAYANISMMFKIVSQPNEA